jgi:hypothetical protein
MSGGFVGGQPAAPRSLEPIAHQLADMRCHQLPDQNACLSVCGPAIAVIPARRVMRRTILGGTVPAQPAAVRG